MKRGFVNWIIGKWFILIAMMTGFSKEGIFEVLIVMVEGLGYFHGLDKFGLVFFTVFAFGLDGDFLGLINCKCSLDFRLGFRGV